MSAALRIAASRAAHRRATVEDGEPSTPTRIPGCVTGLVISISSFPFAPAKAERRSIGDQTRVSRSADDVRGLDVTGQEALVPDSTAIPPFVDVEP